MPSSKTTSINSPRAAKATRPYRALIVVGVVLAVYALLLYFGMEGLHCPFYMLTGYKCPGCGISTMFLCLLRLDLVGAYEANPLLLVTLPFLVFEIGYVGVYQVAKGKDNPSWNEKLLFSYIGLLVLFWVFRNF